jgi:hypothetical protein
MGSVIRLLALLARCRILLLPLAVGVFGCSVCPCGYLAPSAEDPAITRTCYRPDDPPSTEEAAKPLPMPAPANGGHPMQMLALSGGVAGAPFSAGVLVGWSAAGTRPQFDRVTGISSGSLIGAFAFLGPKYDQRLQKLILTVKTEDLFKFRPLNCMLRHGAFGSAKPAERLFQQIYDDEFMTDLRLAHAEGRRFFIGTMNLETRRLAVWDVGAIASSGRADAADLVRKVLLAAVSWPGAFPPVAFDVEIDGRCHREEHCDAGSVAMALPPFAPLGDCPPGTDLYVLTSRKLYSEPVVVPKSAICRLKPSVTAIFEALTRADIARLHSLCLLGGIHFHLLAVPHDFHGEPPSLTNLYPRQARHLFETGYQYGTRGPCWRVTPPGVEPGEESRPRDGSEIRGCP